MLNIVYYLIVVMVLFFAALLIVIGLTGREKRSYSVLAENAQIQVNGKYYFVRELAEKYRPVMYKHASVITPPILWVWYNAVDTGDKIDFIYYNVWENEINPNPLVHSYYSFFRAFYYGYPLYDIEYVQVTLAKADESINKIMFETGPSDNYYSIFNEHIVVKANREPSGAYQIQHINRDTRDEIKSFADQLIFTDTHIQLGVQTWNHLSTLMSAGNESVYTVEVAYNQLKPLSNEEYAKNKFVRKSQGDHVTTENKLSILISGIAIFVFVLVPAMLLSRFKKK